MRNGLVVDEYGNRRWFVNGMLHRTDGPAIEWRDGDRWWYKDGQLHREDGPAVERANGDRKWYRNDRLHRTDGPAIEFTNGDLWWHWRGGRYSFKRWLEANAEITAQQKTLLMLKYGNQ